MITIISYLLLCHDYYFSLGRLYYTVIYIVIYSNLNYTVIYTVIYIVILFNYEIF